MKWLEVITIRSLGKTDKQILDGLLGQISQSSSWGHPPEVKIYHASIVETDLSIHLYWDTEGKSPQQSPLGQQLSYSLKALGLLNHSVWVEAALSD